MRQAATHRLDEGKATSHRSDLQKAGEGPTMEPSKREATQRLICREAALRPSVAGSSSWRPDLRVEATGRPDEVGMATLRPDLLEEANQRP